MQDKSQKWWFEKIGSQIVPVAWNMPDVHGICKGDGQQFNKLIS